MTTSTCPRCQKTFMGRTIGAHAKVCGVTPSELFWQKANRNGPNGCWLWTGSIKPRNGYGHFRVGRKDWNAHRFAYLDTHGSLPAELEVMHTCDVPSCINPAHLRLGTHRDNMQDSLKKGRHTCGERNGHARLTDEIVRAIRKEYRPGNRRTQRGNLNELANRYGVSAGSLYAAATKRTWRHLP